LIRAYYRLTKPGIIYGNAITAIGGYFLAAGKCFNPFIFFGVLFGLSFVIGSACVFNNYIDRNIDSKMARTKNRALAKKTIPYRHALVFGAFLGTLGFLILFLFTNPLTLLVAFIGFFAYVVVYSVWKRRSEWGTVVGSISGAVPPVVGYCAVTHHLDGAAILIFLILCVWQMPHFYAIAIFRKNDYASASIPVLPIRQGIKQTKIQISLYILAFIIANALLTGFHYTGITYLIVMTIAGAYWFLRALQGFKTKENEKWARKLFFISLIEILVFSFMWSVTAFLP
jgi:protoheme IX farnesyltransferase